MGCVRSEHLRYRIPEYHILPQPVHVPIGVPTTGDTTGSQNPNAELRLVGQRGQRTNQPTTQPGHRNPKLGAFGDALRKRVQRTNQPTTQPDLAFGDALRQQISAFGEGLIKWLQRIHLHTTTGHRRR